MATRLNAEKAEGKAYRIVFRIADLGEAYLLAAKNSVLHHRALEEDVEADATMEVTHGMYLKLVSGQVGIVKALAAEERSVSGSRVKLGLFFGLLDEPGGVAVVTP